ncbi:MAG: AMP-binding protein [Paracoccaceae bacterium]
MQHLVHDIQIAPKLIKAKPTINAKDPSSVDDRADFLAAAVSDLSDRDAHLFNAFGAGPAVTPRFSTIIRGFLNFATLTPDAIAAECEGATITYGALDAAANRLASILQNHGVGRGDAVCIYLQRSIPMLVGIIAAMKLGAPYVPQHVGVAPPASLKHISKVVDAKVILTVSGLADQVPVAYGKTLIRIDTVMFDPALNSTPPTSRANIARPDDTCIMLFTSGTTGVPNGVQVTHRNLCNILQTAPGDMGIKPGTRVAQILSIAFDMAAWEILGCLSNGGTLLIRGKNIQETAQRADVLIATPSILNTLDADRCRQIKTAAVAGEPCPRPLADLWGGFCTFYNSCGPTETTIINTAEQHLPEKDRLTIGRPTPNNTVYILDENLRPLPIGEKGEMWAGGDCVTAGYLDNGALNGERYRPDPFLGGVRKMFRTRDIGRWTDTGELEHFGRVDDLVKIRGFRVELDGVSAILEATADCEQAVTVKYDNQNLAAFVSPTSVNTVSASERLRKALPYYCVPAVVLALDTLPRTPRGKIDKRALLQLAKSHVETTGQELN